jgi:YD repeat-containing protein
MRPQSKILLLVLVSLLLIVIVRCDKKDDFDPDSAICQLSTMTFNFTYHYFSSVYETNETIGLQYDLNGRIIEWTSIREHATANYFFTYNTEGKLEEIQFSFHETPYGNYVFTWQGNIATVDFMRMEGGANENDERYVITFNENEEISIVEYYSFYTSEKNWTKMQEYHYTWENGNVSMIEEYYVPYTESNDKLSNSLIDDLKSSSKAYKSANSLMFDNLIPEVKELIKSTTISFTYDNKKSPFSSTIPFFIIYQEAHFASKNNIIKLTATSHSDNSVSSINYTYKYNKYNYPTERLHRASGTDWSSTEKYIFEYSCN